MLCPKDALLFLFRLLLVFGTKAVLFALTDALDIGPVHPDDHAAHDGSSHHADDEVVSGEALEQAVDEGQHRIGCRHCNAAQRHHAGGNKAEQKNAQIKNILKTAIEKFCTPAFARAKTVPIMRPSE